MANTKIFDSFNTSQKTFILNVCFKSIWKTSALVLLFFIMAPAVGIPLWVSAPIFFIWQFCLAIGLVLMYLQLDESIAPVEDIYNDRDVEPDRSVIELDRVISERN